MSDRSWLHTARLLQPPVVPIAKTACWPPDSTNATSPSMVIENAFVLGAVRRLYRDPDDLPLPPVRSLHYFCGLIEEVLDLKTNPKTKSAYLGYFQYLRYKVKTF